MRSSKISVLVGGVLGSVLLMSGAAEAANRDSRERAAKKACLTGDVAKGVDILSDLYIDTNDPTYIFNQGRCYEQNSRSEEAVGRFREYLRKAKNASTAEKAETQSHIDELEALMAKRAAEGAAAVQPAPEPPKPAPPPEPRLPEPARIVEPAPVPPPIPQPAPVASDAAAEQTAAPSPKEPGAGLRVGGIVVASVGAAAVITGLVLNLKHNNTVSDLQGGWDEGKDSSNQSYKTASQVLYGAGAACVVGGAVLYYLGWRAGSTTVAPLALAGGAGATLSGAF